MRGDNYLPKKSQHQIKKWWRSKQFDIYYL